MREQFRYAMRNKLEFWAGTGSWICLEIALVFQGGSYEAAVLAALQYLWAITLLARTEFAIEEAKGWPE